MLPLNTKQLQRRRGASSPMTRDLVAFMCDYLSLEFAVTFQSEMQYTAGKMSNKIQM